ncbi:MAG TPA: gephyrin-like molybdotransferase Glp [Acidimicrobiales bacterium]|nr:gephyrin-like molybdotransferase Glp [Acidimicrobiales bacterium]
MIPLAEAQARVRGACEPLRPLALPLGETLGCVTSVPVRSEVAVPPFANTAVDGYAVRAADTAGAADRGATPGGVRLRVVATLPAGGDPAGLHVGPGEAIRIMTGAPVPAGADAIVMVEVTSEEDGGDTVVITEAAHEGAHVRPAGEDIAPGQEVFPAFTVLTPGHLGVLASIGLRRAPVFPKARVGVLSTGDELVDGGDELRPGQIRDSNRATLLGLVAEAGCVPVDLGLVRDDEDEVRAALTRGVGECDALLTSGGVSMGDFDYVKKVLDELSGAGAGGDAVTWMQVAIRPAKPLSFGVVDGVPVFGLPGNPVSSMVSFELFARPALRQMMGHRHPDRPVVRALADEPLRRRPDGKTHFFRVSASFAPDGRLHVRSSGGQASNLLRSMALANALAVLPDGDGVEAGGEVDVMVLAEAGSFPGGRQ